MMNSMMSRNGYYYGARPYGYGYGYGYGYHSPWHFLGSLLWFLFGLIVIGVIIYLIYRWTRRQAGSTMAYQYATPAAPMSSSPVVTGRTPAAQTGVPFVSAAPAAFSTGPRPAGVNATSAFWCNLPLGSVVSLSDPQALADSEKGGSGRIARECTVEEIRTINEMHGLATWKLFRLYDVLQELWLMVKLVDEHLDLRIYYQLPDDEFKPGNRREMIDCGMRWLFQQPANPDHFRYQELAYTAVIEGPGEAGQPPVQFDMKDQGELHGTMLSTSAQNPNGERCFVTLVEYQANRNCENPELLILEIGGVSPGGNAPDSDDGGLIVLLQGAPIAADEIKVLQGKPH